MKDGTKSAKYGGMALFLLAVNGQTFTSTDVLLLVVEDSHPNITGDEKLGF